MTNSKQLLTMVSMETETITFSHSRLSTFETCPLQYKYRYVDRIKRDVETIEAFMGSRVHDTLEKLYRDIKITKLNSIGDLTTYYNEQWEKHWHDGIWIVKQEYTAQDYRRLGERCLRDYYRRHQPFDDGITLGLEESVRICLDFSKKYWLIGFIDRLTQKPDGSLEIHDYKTAGSLPSQEKIDKDRQLALYQIAIQERFPDAKEVKLIWHYVAFDRDFTSQRTDQQQEELRQKTIELIDKIQTTTDFQPHASQLCYWCEYSDICPLMKHAQKVDTLPVNEYLKEEGVVLVEKYAKIKSEKQETVFHYDEELKKIEEAILAYAKKEGVEVIKGRHNKIRIRINQTLKLPQKTDPRRALLDDLICQSGKWMEVSDLNLFTLARAISTKKLPESLMQKLSTFYTQETTSRIFLSPIKDEERLFEVRDI